MDFVRVDFEKFAVLADGDFANEVALVVELGVGLRDDFALFLVGGEILNLVADPAILCRAVGRFDEAE